jgi:hypothetical protein
MIRSRGLAHMPAFRPSGTKRDRPYASSCRVRSIGHVQTPSLQPAYAYFSDKDMNQGRGNPAACGMLCIHTICSKAEVLGDWAVRGAV